MIHTSDLYATILDLADIPVNKDDSRVDGISLMNVLMASDQRGSRQVSWSDYGPNPAANSRDNPDDGPWGYAIRDSRYKLKSDAIYSETGDVECKISLSEDEVCRTWDWKTKSSFYDLIADPTEQVDLLENGKRELSLLEYFRLSLLRIQQSKILESAQSQ